ncbi:MAG: ABC transporter ATP-binding protein [Candidatus Saccharimonadales bacterium]
MGEDLAISINSLSKDFRLPHERHNSLKQRILSFKKPTYEKFHALRDINFEVKRGEFFGIVGRNGSGKSTLLKIIGGIYQPTKGSVHINGTLTPFIELGIGFNPELTGRENIYLNGAILGLTRKEIHAKYQEIVDFAELHKFMDQKLKNYSSGMQVRLAFSIAMQAHNDILLIDEVLAVGDTNFQRKCYEVFRTIKESGRTVIFVTHDMGAVQEYCDRAMMIQDSRIVAIGKPREIALKYQFANAASEEAGSTVTFGRPKDPAIKIASIRLSVKSKTTKNFTVDDDIEAEIKLLVKKPKEVQVNLFFVRAADGTYLAGVNSTKHIKNFTPSKGTHILTCTIKAGQLTKGDYQVGVGVYTTGYVPDLIDIIDRAYTPDVPRISIIDASTYQAGQFYIQGKWSEKA